MKQMRKSQKRSVKYRKRERRITPQKVNNNTAKTLMDSEKDKPF
jgi:hypothetical protein